MTNRILPQNNHCDNALIVTNIRTIRTLETGIILPPGTVFKVLPNDLDDNRIWLSTSKVLNRAFPIHSLNDDIWVVIVVEEEAVSDES